MLHLHCYHDKPDQFNIKLKPFVHNCELHKLMISRKNSHGLCTGNLMKNTFVEDFCFHKFAKDNEQITLKKYLTQ